MRLIMASLYATLIILGRERKRNGCKKLSSNLYRQYQKSNLSIRIPLQTVLDYTDTANVGATSVVSKTFTIPQDADNIVLKIPVASVNGTAPTVDVYLQTSDDGGTTYYDVARVGIPATVTSSVLSVTNAKALFYAQAVDAQAASVISSPSIRGTAVNTSTGLPIMGQLGQVQISYGGTITTNNGVQVQVKVNSQSSR